MTGPAIQEILSGCVGAAVGSGVEVVLDVGVVNTVAVTLLVLMLQSCHRLGDVPAAFHDE